MSRKILFLINPISGTQTKKKLFELIDAAMRKSGIEYSCQPTDPSGEYTLLKSELNAKKWTDVVVAGGDGSIHAVASVLFGTSVRLGIIPAGSGNGMAYGAGISSNWKCAIETIVRGNAFPTDAYEVNEIKGCMLMGLGYDARVAAAFLHQPKRGFWTYLRICWQLFFEKVNFNLKITTDEGEMYGSFFFVSVANSNQFGNRITIAPKANMQDGKLDLILVSKASAIKKMLGLIRQILFGKPMSLENAKQSSAVVRYIQSSSICIENNQYAPMHVDGEPKESAEKIQIRVIPKAFNIIR